MQFIADERMKQMHEHLEEGWYGNAEKAVRELLAENEELRKAFLQAWSLYGSEFSRRVELQKMVRAMCGEFDRLENAVGGLRAWVERTRI